MTTRMTDTGARRRRSRLGLGLALALGVLMAPPAAWASRPPTALEASRIATAVHNSALTVHVPDAAYTIGFIRVSTIGPWARARIVPRPDRVVQSATAVLSRVGTTWRLRDVGTVDVGCGIVPFAVRRDLLLGCRAVGPTFVSCVPPQPTQHQLHAYRVSCLTARRVAMAVFSAPPSRDAHPLPSWSCLQRGIVQPGGIRSVYWSCTHPGAWRVTWIDHTE
ncbi:MAG TPA: hypothetical protein VHI73_00505 [Solirubrobacteraceae bacterium]|jgi:hypothetical protein|nr:hypothetical protein [Solirubrobacteraceae bacterium]